MAADNTGCAAPPAMFARLKPLLMTALVTVVTIEIWSAYIRPMIFKPAAK